MHAREAVVCSSPYDQLWTARSGGGRVKYEEVPILCESIQDEAIKCRYCGEALTGSEKQVTVIEPATWENAVVLHSDGSPRAFLGRDRGFGASGRACHCDSRSAEPRVLDGILFARRVPPVVMRSDDRDPPRVSACALSRRR